MAIERQRGMVVFVCDGEGGTCGEEFHTDQVEFEDALQVLQTTGRDEGWTVSKESGEWEHICGDCNSLNFTVG